MSGIDPALYQELERLPETQVGEILDGAVVASPRPAPRHANVIAELGATLRDAFTHGRSGPGGWRILPEPELHLGANVMVPDLAGWRRARMPAFPDVAAVTMVPDWVCEVVSPQGARRDRVVKAGIYAANQVPFMWLIDPAMRTLDACRLTGEGWLLAATFADRDGVRAPPFDAVAWSLGELWSD